MTGEPTPRTGQQGGWHSGRFAHTFAAIDLGTNNCRLLVAKASVDGFEVVDAFSRPVRLGEGVALNGSLCGDAIERTLGALDVCAAKIARHKVTRARHIATEACRRACNGDDFLSLVRQRTGLNFEVIPAAEEARLALASCENLLDPEIPYGLLVDIGGGTTDIAIYERGSLWHTSVIGVGGDHFTNDIAVGAAVNRIWMLPAIRSVNAGPTPPPIAFVAESSEVVRRPSRGCWTACHRRWCGTSRALSESDRSSGSARDRFRGPQQRHDGRFARGRRRSATTTSTASWSASPTRS